MRLLFIADGRSPTALNWISYFVNGDHEVHLISTYPCLPSLPYASFNVVPVAFSGRLSQINNVTAKKKSYKKAWGVSSIKVRTAIRQFLGPLTLKKAAQKLRLLYSQIEPELIHAMRIPYEGMLTAQINPKSPLIVSVWGNDFTLHAPSNPLMSALTRRTLKIADVIHADCHRDIRLAYAWGFESHKPTVVLPGGGGVQLDMFFPSESGEAHFLTASKMGNRTINDDAEIQTGLKIINPRGFRAYVKNDAFFKAIPRVLAKHPHARFLCPTMADEPQAQHWLDELGIHESVELLPHQTRAQMAELFRQSRVVVSPSIHDGTPNTLLEAMASGCFPVAGDLESIREWITPGVNGYLVDPTNSDALADAMLLALENQDLYNNARAYNLDLITRRANYQIVMKTAEAFYQELLKDIS